MTLIDYIESTAGAERRAQICGAAGMAAGETVRLDVEYDDGLWQRLYECALVQLARDGVPPRSRAAVEREYAFFAGDWLVGKFPGMLHGITSARDLLRRQPLIHNTMGRAHRNVATSKRVNDKFVVEEQGLDLIVTYSSPNNLSGLYCALVEWVGLKYQERIEIVHSERPGAGQPVHTFRLRFLGRQSERSV